MQIIDFIIFTSYLSFYKDFLFWCFNVILQYGSFMIRCEQVFNIFIFNMSLIWNEFLKVGNFWLCNWNSLIFLKHITSTIIRTVTFFILSFPCEIRSVSNKSNIPSYRQPHTTGALTPLSQCSTEIIPVKIFTRTVENVVHFNTLMCLDVTLIKYEFNLSISQTSHKRVEHFCYINWLIPAGKQQIISIASIKEQQGKSIDVNIIVIFLCICLNCYFQSLQSALTLFIITTTIPFQFFRVFSYPPINLSQRETCIQDQPLKEKQDRNKNRLEFK